MQPINLAWPYSRLHAERYPKPRIPQALFNRTTSEREKSVRYLPRY